MKVPNVPMEINTYLLVDHIESVVCVQLIVFKNAINLERKRADDGLSGDVTFGRSLEGGGTYSMQVYRLREGMLAGINGLFKFLLELERS